MTAYRSRSIALIKCMTEAKTLATDFLKHHDDDRARTILEIYRWPAGRITCPLCNSWQPIYPETRGGTPGYYRCPASHEADAKRTSGGHLVFTVKTGTILQRSHLPLAKWLYCLATVSPRGITVTELAARICITRKTAARVLKLMLSLEGAGSTSRPSKSNAFLVKYILDNCTAHPNKSNR